MWWSGNTISERSPGCIGSEIAVESAKASMPATVSSAPRGSEVVPLVKTIIAVSPSRTRQGRCQMVLKPALIARWPALSTRSVLRVPKPPVLSPGVSAATSCALSA